MSSTTEAKRAPGEHPQVPEGDSPIRRVLGSPIAFLATALILLALFGWTFIANPDRVAPTKDPAYYTWRTELITTETEDENPCFSDNRAREDLGEFLKENPAARARIVIKISSVRDFNEETKVIRNTLSKEYGIASGRVRFVHVRTPAWPKGPMKETEYWLLPKTPGK